VIASPQDAALLRAELGPDSLIVTPGVLLRSELSGGIATEALTRRVTAPWER
jgi:orotidine-5'-phosphate decarboxylase